MLLFGMSNTGRWCTCVRVLRGLGVVEANLQDLFGMPSVEPGAGFEAGKRQEQRPLGDVRHEKPEAVAYCARQLEGSRGLPMRLSFIAARRARNETRTKKPTTDRQLQRDVARPADSGFRRPFAFLASCCVQDLPNNSSTP